MENKVKKSYYDRLNKSLYEKTNKRKVKDNVGYGLIYGAAGVTVGILLWIMIFIFYKGVPLIDLHFLTANFDNETVIVTTALTEGSENQLGIQVEQASLESSEYVEIVKIEESSSAKESLTKQKKTYALKKGDIIKKIGRSSTENMTVEEINELINSQTGDRIELKIVRVGGGIVPMVVTTLYLIGLSLLISCPIGIFAAIYLVEYAKPGKVVRLIRFATESLAGIPSIIFGLFGVIMFVEFFGFKMSIIAGAFTMSLILLPVIIRQTEESLKTVPISFREASFGLGAGKLYTIRKAVLPSAIPGILVAVLLSIGRIIGESAALLLTAGTAAKIPENVFATGGTLTIRAYVFAKEHGDIASACALGVVIITIILILNGISKLITMKMMKKA